MTTTTLLFWLACNLSGGPAMAAQVIRLPNHLAMLSLQPLPEIDPTFFTMEELTLSSGTYYSLANTKGLIAKERNFAIVDDSSDMVIRLNGKSHRLKLVSTSFKMKTHITDGVAVGDRILETYASSEINVYVERMVTAILSNRQERFEFQGSMNINYGSTSKSFKIFGVSFE